MSKVVTLQDVADKAGVSLATASNALQRPKRVARPTRERVLAVADELGYAPSSANRKNTLRRRVGVVAPFSSHSSYAERLKGILSECSEGTIEALIFDHPSASRSPSPRLATLPFSGNLDGLVIMGVPIDDEFAQRLSGQNLPTVLIDTAHPDFTSVTLDEAQGTQLAALALMNAGCSRFVYVTEGQVSYDYLSQGTQRRASFYEALAEHGIDDEAIETFTVVGGTVSGAAGLAVEIAELAGDDKVGVLCGHDALAAGLLSGLRAAGVDVPGRACVIGWDGGELVEALGLSTVRQPLEESGRIGARRLMALIDGDESAAAYISLRPELVAGLTS